MAGERSVIDAMRSGDPGKQLTVLGLMLEGVGGGEDSPTVRHLYAKAAESAARTREAMRARYADDPDGLAMVEHAYRLIDAGRVVEGYAALAGLNAAWVGAGRFLVALLNWFVLLVGVRVSGADK